MNKKIAIYGDSYAANWGTFTHPYWSNILQNEYGWNIHNHAYGGTGLDYSYRKFLQSYDTYDTIIFVLSHPHRKTVWNLMDSFPHDAWITKTHRQRVGYLMPEIQLGAFDGWETVSKELSGQDSRETKWWERFTDKENYDNVNERFKRATDYNDLQNKYNELNYLEYHAMVDSIKSRHDDVIIIPAFNYYQDSGLFNITQLDWKFYGTNTETGNRFNHMSREQCETYAYLLHQRLQNKECKKYIEAIDPEYVEQYFKVSMTLHDAGLKK